MIVIQIQNAIERVLKEYEKFPFKINAHYDKKKSNAITFRIQLNNKNFELMVSKKQLELSHIGAEQRTYDMLKEVVDCYFKSSISKKSKELSHD